jgi:hypothetical protein
MQKSGLRKFTKPDAPEAGQTYQVDEESLLRRAPTGDSNNADDDKPSPKSSSPKLSPYSNGGGASTSAATSNPLLVAKLLARKVLHGLMSDDQDANDTSGGVIPLFKDIIIGVTFGVVTISFMIFLDHINIIHLQSAHNFRETAFRLLNDPETISTLEESTDMKFMPFEEYDAIKTEIEEARSKLTAHESTIEARTKEAEEKRSELAPLKEEYDRLVANSNLELDKFCDGCKWNGGSTCGARKQYLSDTYNTSPVEAIVSIMKSAPQCKKE